MTDTVETVGRQRSFGGWMTRYRHRSAACACDMVFAVYTPPQAESQAVPVLYWLSGLTCTDENFNQKAGAHRYAAEKGLAIVCPDTSPRGVGLPGEDDSYDFGSGAGFYLNATEAPWSSHYRMYDYVVEELPGLLKAQFPALDSERCAISGHSMGGHGALTIALKNPGRYGSVSAFAPICSPTRCPWGEKALPRYLGEDRSTWTPYDATLLIPAAQERLPLLVDQGEDDNFLQEQLKPELLEAACRAANHTLTLRRQPGYDHSYYFISSFIGDHVEHHAKALGL
ncbi:MAG: S-formylglutathione hydrolase [Candidatus Competibacterales bacterium]